MLGGLARRSTIFNQLKKENKNIFFIGGFYEITNFGMPPTTNINQLLKIYTRLPYNLKVLTEQEKNILGSKSPLDGWIISGNKITIKTFLTSMGPINFVILPENKKILEENTTQKELYKIKERSKLLIGISPYGYLIEKNLLKEQNLSQIFDIFLGSGRGASFKYEYVKNHCVWIRPTSKGKIIYIITITELPKLENLIPGKNVSVEKRFITQDIMEDPVILGTSNKEKCY